MEDSEKKVDSDLEVPLKNPPRRRLKWIILALVVALAGIGAGLGVVLWNRSHNDARSKAAAGSKGSSPSSGTTSGAGPTPTGPTSGKAGSVLTFEDGKTFTYANDFGGEWAMDPREPFAAGGKAQSWSPRVGAEEWRWGKDVVRGVNLGGWLVTEPFIVPFLYEEYVGRTPGVDVVDEWTLSQAMGTNLSQRMEQHYRTFVTEQDFVEIAAAGLNWVRIPIGYWAIETTGTEPFLAQTSWKYFLKAIEWARKYGLRVYLDIHALPGSQNAWDHSGKRGQVNIMHGTMGIANSQRSLSYIRTIVQFVSQPQYRDVVPLVGIVNEILMQTIQRGPVQSFYYAAYEAFRKATGIGAGPYMVIHDGFSGPGQWDGFLAGSDRVILDRHPYLAYRGSRDPLEQLPAIACGWGSATNRSSKNFGITVGGEFSTAVNDCGLWLNGIGTVRADCAETDNWAAYTPATVESLKRITLASMDALQNYFFWTWKVGNSTTLGTVSAGLWSYKLGLQQGWIPKDPREAVGYCASIGAGGEPFDGVYPATATGGPGAGTLDPAMRATNTFPPPDMAQLPTYTPTGALRTLPGPTFTAAPGVSVGSGWFNPADNEPAYVPVRGCTYPDPWNAVDAPVPAACT